MEHAPDTVECSKRARSHLPVIRHENTLDESNSQAKNTSSTKVVQQDTAALV